MKKSLTKSVVILFLALIVLMTTNLNAFAASGESVTILESDTPSSLTVTRRIEGVTNKVNNTYTYTVNALDSNPTGASNEPTTFTINFNNVQPGGDNVATSTSVLDFTGTTYTQVGDYTYIVTETASSDETNFPISEQSYEVYVSVRYAVDENNIQISPRTLVATLSSQAIEQTDLTSLEKSDIVFTSSSELTYINVSKEIRGNFAENEEYFKFLLKINGQTGDEYQIIGQDENINYKGEDISTSNTYTVDNSDQYVYLKHGQTITIGKTSDELSQIKSGITFQLIEQDAENYTTYINGSNTVSKDTGVLTTVSDSSRNNASFVNDDSRTIKTGVMLTIAPFAILMIVSVCCLLLIKGGNKLKTNDGKME